MQDPPPPSVWHNIKYVYCSYCCSVGDDFKVCKNTRLQVADDMCAAFPSHGNIINIPFILKLQQYEQQISNLQKCHAVGYWHLCSVPILIQTCSSVPSVSFCTSVPCQINRTLLHPMKSWCAFITSPTPLGMAALSKSPVASMVKDSNPIVCTENSANFSVIFIGLCAFSINFGLLMSLQNWFDNFDPLWHWFDILWSVKKV